jgi:uncharacterized membrane protein YccC
VKVKPDQNFRQLYSEFSIIAIYVILGTLAAILFGPAFANFLSTHWLPNVLFFLIFWFFAASFFGMFELTHYQAGWQANLISKQTKVVLAELFSWHLP